MKLVVKAGSIHTSYKSPGFYFLPSISDLAFKRGRPLFKIRRLFSIEQNNALPLIEAKLEWYRIYPAATT